MWWTVLSLSSQYVVRASTYTCSSLALCASSLSLPEHSGHFGLPLTHCLYKCVCVYLQSKSRVWQSTTHTTSPPLSPRAPSGVDGETAVGGGGVEDAAEAVLNDQQELAMQQEERILAEQIESLQKEKYAVSVVILLHLSCAFLLHMLHI